MKKWTTIAIVISLFFLVWNIKGLNDRDSSKVSYPNQLGYTNPQLLNSFDSVYAITKDLMYVDLDTALQFINNYLDLKQDKLPQLLITRAQQLSCSILLKKLNYESARKLNEEILLKLDTNSYSSELAHYYETIGIINRGKGEYTKAIVFLNKALQIGTQIKEFKIITSAHNHIGGVYYYKTNYDSALYHFNKIIELADLSQSCQLDKARGILNIGLVHAKLGSYIEAAQYYNRSYHLKMKLGVHPSEIVPNLEKMAEIYFHQQQFEQAIIKFEEALQKAKNIPKPKWVIKSQLGLAKSYFQINNDKEGLKYASQALRSSKEVADQNLIVHSLIVRGQIYLSQQNYRSALKDLEEAKLKLQKLGSAFLECDVLIYLGQIYYNQGKIDLSKSSTLNGLSLASKKGLKKSKMEAHQQLYQIYQDQKNYEKAFFHHDAFTRLEDSLYNEQSIREFKNWNQSIHFKESKREEARAIYDKDAKQKLELTTVRNALRFFFIVLAILVSFFLLTLFVRREKNLAHNKLKQKESILSLKNKEIEDQKNELVYQAKALQNLNTTKDQLLAILSHDLRSPIGKLESSLDLLLSKDLNRTEFLELANHLKQNTIQIYYALENLINWISNQLENTGHKNLQTITVNNELDNLITFFGELSKQKNIDIINKVDLETRVILDLEDFTIIFRNLIGNALKFTPEYGQIILNNGKDEEYFFISVSDTGIGISEEQREKLFELNIKKRREGTMGEKGIGLGLNLCFDIINKYNGYIEVDSKINKGSTFKVYFPKSTLIQNMIHDSETKSQDLLH